ncbi:alpha/beta fold hydrolase [Rathayibacter soli]|uniref:alpha/beta fold hydrolase n=1 Tax=Rathayibacter soli TaxID=3144168 RepID=UPI0027E44545|nr:alpha/beta hydrolase [Glaciibacter superstes]
MANVRDLQLQDGRTLRVHDSARAADATNEPTVLWHHGSPQTGALLEPLLAAAAARGIRMLSYGRPGYGGSSPHPGRSVGSAASDVEQLVDTLGVERFAVMGASGGGPHALACAALLPERVVAVACLATLAPLAPYAADGLDWFAGMASDGASLRAAVRGRAAREEHENTAEFDPSSFLERDYAALNDRWSSLGADVAVASAAGPNGLIDDDLAYVAPWGFEIANIGAPVLLVHGSRDRVVPPAHSEWLLRQLPDAELWVRPRDGHISVLDACPVALDWLRARW